MKKIISVLAVFLLVTACENKKDEVRTNKNPAETSNEKAKKPKESSPQPTTNTKKTTTAETPAKTEKTENKNIALTTYKGEGYGNNLALDCSVVVPANAIDLASYAIGFIIQQKEEPMMISSHPNLTVAKSSLYPHVYTHSSTEIPSVVLEYQADKLVKFTLITSQSLPSNLKIYTCNFE